MPALLARREGTPHCSSSATACWPVLPTPATSSRDSTSSNGNGTSEPMSTSGRSAPSVRTWSARKIIGGIPTPPPSASSRGRVGSTVKPWPIGASTLMTSPGCRRPSSSSPWPFGACTRIRASLRPRSTRMIDNGRRIGTDGSQAMCANVPGTALRAARGAWTRRTNCSPGHACCARMRASSRNTLPRLRS